MVKASVVIPPNPRMTVDAFLRELVAGCRELPRMTGRAPIKRHLPTEIAYQVQIRADVMAELEDDTIWNAEWQTSHKTGLGQRMFDTRRGIEKNYSGAPEIVQHVIRIDGVDEPAPVVAKVAGVEVEFEVLTLADLDLEPLFASEHVNDRIVACLFTDDPHRLIEVREDLAKSDDPAERGRGLHMFALMTQFRLDRGALPEEVAEMVTGFIEIDFKRNPVTKPYFEKGREEGAREQRVRMLRLVAAGLGDVDQDMLDGLEALSDEDLDRKEQEIMDALPARAGSNPGLR